MEQLLTLLLILLIILHSAFGEFKYGLLQNGNNYYCAGYLPEAPLPNENAPQYNYSVIDPGPLSSDCLIKNSVDSGKFVVISYDSDCTPNDAVVKVIELGGAGILFYGNKFDNLTDISGNLTSSGFIIGFINSEMYQVLNLTLETKLYKPDEVFSFDYSLIILAVLAIGLFTLGSLSNSTYLEILLEAYKKKSETSEKVDDIPPGLIAAITGVVLLFTLIIMVVVLYFIYSISVFFFIGLFFVYSIKYSFEILVPLIPKSGYLRKCVIRVPGLEQPLVVYRIVLFLLCMVLPIVWLCFRNKPFAWDIQTILGCTVCIGIIRGLKMPSLSMCVVFLIVVFIYDIFVVFVSRFITSDGIGILDSIITGEASGLQSKACESVPPIRNNSKIIEMFPFVFKFPPLTRMKSLLQQICFSSPTLVPKYTMLGFGDIIFPAMLSTYAHNYDSIHKTSRSVYSLITILCYTIGLFIAVIVASTTQVSQPALLYIVPTMLIPFLIVASVKNDLKNMWYGYNIKLPEVINTNTSEAVVAQGNQSGVTTGIVNESMEETQSTTAPDETKQQTNANSNNGNI